MAEDNEGIDDINTKDDIEESNTIMDDADKEAKVEDSVDVEKEKNIEVKAEEAAVSKLRILKPVKTTIEM